MTRKEMREDLERRCKQLEGLMNDGTKIEERKKLTGEIEQITVELRAMDKADEELRAAKEAEARMVAPPASVEVSGWAGVRKQILGAIETGKRSAIDLSGIERRAITANGAGANTVPGIIRTLVDGGKLRSKVSVFLGRNSVTTVPVWAPSVAIPVGSVPGATGTSSDSTAVLTGDPLTLKPWYSTLAISMGALISTDIESEMPSITAEAFGAAIDKMICVGAGSGSDGLGVFIASSSGVPTGSDITMTTSAAAPLWVDYINMALQLLALGGDISGLAIVVNPAVFKTALGDATAGNDAMKVEFLTRGTILGIPVILSSYALTTLTAGSYVAVGGNFKHYALAIAQEMVIDQIKTVGSDNVTFQAFVYMQGKPLIGGSFRRLKTGT